MIALKAFLSSLGQVLRAPFTLAAVLTLTIITVLPFGLVMGSRLQSALNDQPPVMLGSEEIDADWWLEFRRHRGASTRHSRPRSLVLPRRCRTSAPCSMARRNDG